MRKITKIIVHCSVSGWGSSSEIDKWHRERGFRGIGYHYVILNGFLSPGVYQENYDGVVEDGRDIEQEGAHVKGMNSNTIGICLIGDSKFSRPQIDILYKLLYLLCKKYNLSRHDILGHYETPTGITQGKTCPNINMEKTRTVLVWKFFIYKHIYRYKRFRILDLFG